MNNVIKIVLIVVLFGTQMSKAQENSTIDYRYLWEEEKLAHDIYDTLGKKWDLRVFHNIKQSERRHMESVEIIIKEKAISFELFAEKGKFHSVVLQNLYNKLLAKGLQSPKSALEVGRIIEKTDISDLEIVLTKKIPLSEKQILESLLFASKRHLAAFERKMSQL
ncbi:DUF2202 domain-containing protein [Flavobacterium luminosum]|uniref:DUF2202 domain-containing protein n=1 Tax=Flavobacterium luminosum TaxID=2949086 RepID=A0ABT0TNG5_9FLAO|nr:DUF2202 domain-containing protein [Flavobacterium sp. HXWNR70]MCL9808890.1 DUF2202 domain-containing protein [Flavobacterium sp. HXWNR70]